MKLTILAINRDGSIEPPRTKKNSAQLIPNMKRPLLVPSVAYRDWEKAAIKTWLGEGIIQRGPPNAKGKPTYIPCVHAKPIDYPVNCRALIYREKLIGDAVGFYQAIGDFLQLAGVVTNDRFVVSWDGSRLLKDSVRPRVELVIERVGDCVQGELFEESEE